MKPTFKEALRIFREWPECVHAYDPWIDFEKIILSDGRDKWHATYYGWTAMLHVESGYENAIIADIRVNFPWEGWSDEEVPEIYSDLIVDSLAEFIDRIHTVFGENGWQLDGSLPSYVAVRDFRERFYKEAE